MANQNKKVITALAIPPTFVIGFIAGVYACSYALGLILGNQGLGGVLFVPVIVAFGLAVAVIFCLGVHKILNGTSANQPTSYKQPSAPWLAYFAPFSIVIVYFIWDYSVKIYSYMETHHIFDKSKYGILFFPGVILAFIIGQTAAYLLAIKLSVMLR